MKEKMIDEYEQIKANPYADSRRVREMREKLLWIDTSSLSQDYKNKLYKIL